MGKKVERNAREKPPQTADDSGDKTPEPYQCTGHFHTDFAELCKQGDMYRPPPVILRPKRPVSPTQMASNDNVGGGKKGKDDKKLQQQQQQQQQEEEQESAEDREIIERLGFKPKTFGVRDGLEYMKPSVQVEMENPEKQETVTEVFVRGWLVESTMMQTFRQCFLVMTKLNCIHFWRTGLTAQRISDLASIVSQCEHLKTLIIEANDRIPEENFYELIKEDSHLTKLQLRFCGITEYGASLLGEQLGNVKTTNTKLVSLDLSGNAISDKGAIALAKALRTNRTLLHLSVSHNNIGNAGAKAFGEVLSRFFLTMEEILERRLLMSEKGSGDRAKSVSSFASASSFFGSPPPSRRGDSKDRPGSVKSTDREKGKKRDTSSKNKKDAKEKEDKTKGKKDDKVGGKKASLTSFGPPTVSTSPRPSRRPSVQFVLPGVDAANGSASPASRRSSTVGDPKAAAKTKGKGGKGSKTVAAVEQSEHARQTPISENLENLNPLLEKVESIEPGNLLIPGNFNLILLNLSRNLITEKGVEELKTAMAYQVTHIALEQKVNGTGLMKLILKGNKFSEDYPAFKKLEEVMLPRDPFHKAAPKSPDTESHHS